MVFNHRDDARVTCQGGAVYTKTVIILFMPE